MNDPEGPPAWREAAPWVLSIPPAPEWTKRAACTEHDPTLWDYGKGEGLSPRTRRAIEICRACLVRRECLVACYEPIPKPFVVTGSLSKELGVSRLDVDMSDDSSEYGIWGGTLPHQRRAVRHLPLELRIETLLAQVESDRTGIPPRRLHLTAEEIIARWRELGRPPEVPASAFRGVARRYGGSTITHARRALSIVVELDRHPDSGQVAAWRWKFPEPEL